MHRLRLVTVGHDWRMRESLGCDPSGAMPEAWEDMAHDLAHNWSTRDICFHF